MRHLTILAAGTVAGALAATSALAVPGVATGNVNLRADATVNAQRLTTIPEGARVEVHGCPSWCNVTFNGITGWVSPNYISTQVAVRGDRNRYDRDRYDYDRGPRFGLHARAMPPRAYWRFGRPRWDDRYGYWRDRRDRWWYDGRWHHRRPGGITFEFGF